MTFTTDRFFLDTNILVYANDKSSRKKQRIARELIAHAFKTRMGVISTQVLQEFYVVATQKAAVAPLNARSQVIIFKELDTIESTTDIVLSAIDLQILQQISFWDAMIVKAAALANCKVLYSEDFNAGQVIEGVQVLNPFA